VAGILLFISICLSIYLLNKQHRLHKLLDVFVNNESYLLSIWSIIFLFFLTYLRSVFHFDAIGPRLISPAGITLSMQGAALLLLVMEPLNIKNAFLYRILAILVFVVWFKEIHVFLTKPTTIPGQYLEQSERLNWINQRSEQNNLYIGDDTVDIPFYFIGRLAVSFSPYPYTKHLSYDDLLTFSRHNCLDYQNIYLILRKVQESKNESTHHYGEFITDLRNGDYGVYSDVLFIESLSDADIFRVPCK